MGVFLSIMFGLNQRLKHTTDYGFLMHCSYKETPTPKSALVEIDTTGNGCAGNAVFLLGFYWLQSALNKYKPFMRIFSLQVTIYMNLSSIN